QLEDSGAYSRKISETGWVICGAPSYLDRYGIPATPHDLSRHNCLNFSIHTHDLPWLFRDGARMLRPNVRGNVTSNQAEALRLLGLHGLGLIRVSDFVVANDIAAGMLVQVLVDYTASDKDPIWAVYPKRERISSRVRFFLDFLTDRRS